MRLRNIPRAGEYIEAHTLAVNEPKANKGKWNSEFQNDHPIYIEIGMGKGQFLLALARQNPEINYVGIERYSSVLLRAIEKFDEEDDGTIHNLRFICMDARELDEVFAKEEVAKIYLNFSDPWPKSRHASRRLTSKEFFARYEKVLQKTGTVEFKTDNRGLFDFSLEQVGETNFELLAHTFDLHNDEVLNEGNVMTEYEAKFSSMGNPIHKLIARQKK